MATSDTEPEVILEPGDPGYVAPTQPEAVPITTTEPAAEAPAAEAVPVPPGKDVRIPREPNETDAEYETRTRNVVPVSESPTDIVPNRPNIVINPVQPAPEPVTVTETGEKPA